MKEDVLRKVSCFAIFVSIGPSGVRALPLGCRHKRSGHSTWHYWSERVGHFLGFFKFFFENFETLAAFFLVEK